MKIKLNKEIIETLSLDTLKNVHGGLVTDPVCSGDPNGCLESGYIYCGANTNYVECDQDDHASAQETLCNCDEEEVDDTL